MLPLVPAARQATKTAPLPHWREIVTHEIRRLWRHEVHIAWVRHTQQEFAEIIQRQFSQAADSVIDGCTASATFLRLTGDFKRARLHVSSLSFRLPRRGSRTTGPKRQVMRDPSSYAVC